MAINHQLADIDYKLNQIVQGLSEISRDTEGVKATLKYDIEPKLDKALEGKGGAAETPQKPPEDRLRHLRYAILYATSERKIEAIKSLREATGAGLKEAKDTIEWLIERVEGVIASAKQKEAE